MSNQTKVTDFFVSQKKSDNCLRSVGKNIKNGSKLADIESKSGQQMLVLDKTPKRKKVVTNDMPLKSSKRKKTPKNETIIEFKTSCETKNVSTNEVKTERQLNANEVKERLLKCNNLLELKKQLSTINDCAAKVKQFKEIKILSPNKGFRTPTKTPTKAYRTPRCSPNRRIGVFSPNPPLKSPISVTPNKDLNSYQTYRRRLFDVFEDESSPQKTENKSKECLRAFERFSYLVSKPDANQTLVLPQKFKVLSEMFKSMDTIVSMHYKRQEVLTFDKLKESVERMTNKKFDSKRLSQILTLFSDGFKLKYELFASILDNRKPSHQLIVSPIYNSNVDIRLSSGHLLERYQLFVTKLLDITKGHHKKYLNRLGLSVEESELVRWHPKFRLDSVPDIEPNLNALPVEPKCGETSAEVFLETSRQRLGLPTTAQTKDDNSIDNKIDNKSTDSSNQKITKGLLKGLSMDLLNKIRAKEAANLIQEMTRRPEVDNELRILRSLPEFIRIIHTFFIGTKKMAIPYDQLIDKIINSFSASLSILRAREHMDYMCQLLPNWIYLLEVKKGNYIKINKEMSLSLIDNRIKQRVNQLNK